MNEVNIRAEDLVNQVDKMTSLPNVYFKIKSLIDDPRSSLAQLGEVISQDPALTVQVLRIVNSAFFGFAAKITTVNHAVNMLGTQQVHDLALAASVASAFDNIFPAIMDMQKFWRNSVYCGIVSRLIAIRCNVLDSERLFVEGLLCDIGHLAMYERLPEISVNILQKAKETGEPAYQIERATLGFDYTQIGAMLMQKWHLPESLQESIHFHQEPEKALTFPLEASIVHIASRITNAIESGQDVTQWSILFSPFALQTTGLSENDFQLIIAEADELISETVALFFPKKKYA